MFKAIKRMVRQVSYIFDEINSIKRTINDMSDMDSIVDTINDIDVCTSAIQSTVNDIESNQNNQDEKLTFILAELKDQRKMLQAILSRPLEVTEPITKGKGRIIELLKRKKMTVKELSSVTGKSCPTVRYHLKKIAKDYPLERRYKMSDANQPEAVYWLKS